MDIVILEQWPALAVVALVLLLALHLLLRYRHKHLLERLRQSSLDSHRLEQRLHNLERGQRRATVIATERNARNHFVTEMQFCETTLAGMERGDRQRPALELRRRILQAEILAFDTGSEAAGSLPLVMPAYVITGRGRGSTAGQEILVLKQRLAEADMQLQRLKNLETLYHDLKAAVGNGAQTGIHLATQLADKIAPMADPDMNQVMSSLLQNFQDLQSMMQTGDKYAQLQLTPDMALAIEQGRKLESMFSQGQDDIDSLRRNMQEQSGDVARERAEIDVGEHPDVNMLRTQVKQHERHLQDALGCIETLEKNLLDSRTLLKKFIDRARRYQDQESRIAILDARSKQADKDLRTMSRLHQQMDAKLKAQDKQLQAGVGGSGGDSAYKALQLEMISRTQELDRLRTEKAMLDEQVVALDRYRDLAEQAQQQLQRLSDEKQMLEEQILAFADDEVNAVYSADASDADAKSGSPQ